MLYVGVFAIFAAVFLAIAAASDLVLERQRVFRNLRSVRAIELTPTDMRKRELSAPFMQRALFPFLRTVTKFFRKATPQGAVERLAKEIVYAGNPPGWDAERVLAIKIVTFFGALVVALLAGRFAALSGLQSIILFLLFGFIGWYLPEWALRSKSKKRQDTIRRALPDALDLLSITVEAGLGFDAAVSRVARQAGGPLGGELHRVLQEMQIGKTRADALRDLGERSTVPELKSFVLAMIQADIFGISIAKVLHVQANEMRIKRRQRAEEAAQKVPVKIVFPLITCIFPALFVVLLGPAAITIYNNILKRPGG